jgi:hypothetical protein
MRWRLSFLVASPATPLDLPRIGDGEIVRNSCGNIAPTCSMSFREPGLGLNAKRSVPFLSGRIHANVLAPSGGALDG